MQKVNDAPINNEINTKAVEQTYEQKKTKISNVMFSLRSVPNAIEITRISHKGGPTFIKP